VTASELPSASPTPDGVKTSVWLSLWRHEPAVAGDSVGSEEPISFVTGSEKVRVIGAAGERVEPGAGLAITTGALDGGNQVTVSGEPSFSHGRTAALTSALPEPPRPGSVIARVGPLSASATAG